MNSRLICAESDQEFKGTSRSGLSLRPYDPDGLFEVEVISDTSRELNVFTVEVTPKEELAEGDGLKALNFSEKVEICRSVRRCGPGIDTSAGGYRSGDQGNGEKPDL